MGPELGEFIEALYVDVARGIGPGVGDPAAEGLVTITGKTYKPRRNGAGAWEITLTLIETRGEGGLFLCHPTPGYVLVQGEINDLPLLTAEHRDVLLEAAWSLKELIPPPVAV